MGDNKILYALLTKELHSADKCCSFSELPQLKKDNHNENSKNKLQID